ncbi:MAG: lysylphosphatidylglycerol synthase domain-containing protein, partial [Elusimicrobia bacterium]|nr:lysylphosphatidylglycerol synthase domain-containing protein [Elusimicrobiota bacterium]
APAVWRQVSRIGWGFLVIIPMQLCDQVLNAAGWRFAFGARDAARVGFWDLVRARVAGDGVNYLTPSGTIAGEIIRPGMLPADLPAQTRNSSVVVAKVAQSLGQALFALVGLLVLIPLRLGFLSGRQVWGGLLGSLLVLAAVCGGLLALTARRPDGTYAWRLPSSLEGMRGQMAEYLRAQPGRFAASTLFFWLGFAWGAVEVMVICRCLGLRVDVVTAFSIEVLSVAVDSLFFMVPAKVGTQEAGKTAIFAGLGMPPALGLAFGLARHARELAWAGLGFALYAWNRRRLSCGARVRCAPPQEPVAPGA